MDKKEFNVSIDYINRFADELVSTKDRSNLALACILKNVLAAVKTPNNEMVLLALVESTIFVSESLVARANETHG